MDRAYVYINNEDGTNWHSSNFIVHGYCEFGSTIIQNSPPRDFINMENYCPNGAIILSESILNFSVFPELIRQNDNVNILVVGDNNIVKYKLLDVHISPLTNPNSFVRVIKCYYNNIEVNENIDSDGLLDYEEYQRAIEEANKKFHLCNKEKITNMINSIIESE
jgi:hypothetical protein